MARHDGLLHLGESGLSEWRNNVLVIVSNRFGLKSIGQEYFKVIKKYMKLPSFVGLVGGKPRFAYYFVGHLEKPAGSSAGAFEAGGGSSGQEEEKHDETDRLVFLDPHYVNPQIDWSKNIVDQEDLYHCKQGPRSIHMQNLDPCMSFGFLLKSRADFTQFSEQIAAGILEDGERRIFHLQDNLECSLRSVLSFQSSAIR